MLKYVGGGELRSAIYFEMCPASVQDGEREKLMDEDSARTIGCL